MRYLLILAQIISSAAVAQDACKQREKFYTTNYVDSIDKGIQSIQLSSTDVLLIGEPHNNFGDEIYPKILTALSVNKFNVNCLFLEQHKDSHFDSTLSYFNSNPSASAVMRKRLKKQLFPGTYDWVIKFYEAGVKLYAVDNHDVDYEDETLWLNKRDEFMAKTIKDLFKSGKCRKAVYPVGALHITKVNNRNQSRVTLKRKLELEDYNVVAINLDLVGWHQEISAILDGETGKPSSPRLSSSWIPLKETIKLNEYSLDAVERNMICESNPKLPQETPRVYRTKDLESTVPMTFDRFTNRFVGDLRDFSLSISYSCQSKSCINQNKKVQSDLEKKGYIFY